VRPIRVLVVDDSAVVRRALAELVAGDPELELAGAAPTGRLGLARLARTGADVVVLDVDMPGMDGLETLEAIRRSHPRLPVIMFSVLTERGAEVTLRALFRGAQDYVTKPTAGGREAAAEVVRRELIPRIKALGAGRVGEGPGPAAPPPARPPGAPPAALVVAASTGGPAALERLLAEVPRPAPVPVLVVQHMPPLFTGHLARQLAAKTGHEVREAASGVEARPGVVWVAPGGRHLEVIRDPERPGTVRLRLSDDPPVNSCRPSADVLFRAAARAWGGGVLAVVLTGMGRDGLEGCRAVRAAGGTVLAQDRATSVVWGMPGFVASEGLAHGVLPLDRLAAAVAEVLREGTA